MVSYKGDSNAKKLERSLPINTGDEQADRRYWGLIVLTFFLLIGACFSVSIASRQSGDQWLWQLFICLVFMHLIRMFDLMAYYHLGGNPTDEYGKPLRHRNATVSRAACVVAFVLCEVLMSWTNQIPLFTVFITDSTGSEFCWLFAVYWCMLQLSLTMEIFVYSEYLTRGRSEDDKRMWGVYLAIHHFIMRATTTLSSYLISKSDLYRTNTLIDAHVFLVLYALDGICITLFLVFCLFNCQ